MEESAANRWVLGLWFCAVVLIGGVLTSFHQPFLSPGEGILHLARNPSPGHWRVIHVLSGSCGCSRKVMLHLLERRPMSSVIEQILIVDGEEPLLPATPELLENLRHAGYTVTHLTADDLANSTSNDAGLRGVPLLVIAAPQGKAVYMGGYGNGGDQDVRLFQAVRSGQTPKPLPLIGCAIGSRLRRSADPFHLKY